MYIPVCKQAFLPVSGKVVRVRTFVGAFMDMGKQRGWGVRPWQ